MKKTITIMGLGSSYQWLMERLAVIGNELLRGHGGLLFGPYA